MPCSEDSWRLPLFLDGFAVKKDSEGGVHPGEVFGFVVLVCTLQSKRNFARFTRCVTAFQRLVKPMRYHNSGVLVRLSANCVIPFASLTPLPPSIFFAGVPPALKKLLVASKLAPFLRKFFQGNYNEIFIRNKKRGKPFLKKRFFPSDSPFQKTIVRGEIITVRSGNSQSAKIRIIRQIRERTDLQTIFAERLASIANC